MEIVAKQLPDQGGNLLVLIGNILGRLHVVSFLDTAVEVSHRGSPFADFAQQCCTDQKGGVNFGLHIPPTQVMSARRQRHPEQTSTPAADGRPQNSPRGKVTWLFVSWLD